MKGSIGKPLSFRTSQKDDGTRKHVKLLPYDPMLAQINMEWATAEIGNETKK